MESLRGKDGVNPNWPADWVDRLTKSVQEHESSRRLTLGKTSRYDKLRVLGRGGMGVVYRAMDRVLSREVALKELVDPLGAPAEARTRFLEEARLAATLQHPNIVPIFDAGEYEGQVFLAMQLIDGSGLEGRKMELREAVAAIRDAARAVHFAHERGIIHRDLKPSNVMVDKTGRVYVTDFGLARRSDSAARMTLTGTIIGTPIYMPPEQARGTETDARSDVYSLGATLYELASGKPPFSGPNELAILKHVLLDEPPFPRKHAPSLPQDLESVIVKAMDKKPAGRYGTAAALADDLDRWLRSEPVEAPVRGTFYRVRKKIARHRWRVLATAATIGFLASTGAFAWPYVQARRAYLAAMAAENPARRRQLLEIASSHDERARQALKDLDEQDKSAGDRRIEVLTHDKERGEEEARARENRLKAISALTGSFHKDVDLLDFSAAEEKLAQLRAKNAEDLDALQSRLLKAQFESGLATLTDQATKLDSPAFQETFQRLRSERFQHQKDRDLKLGKAALDFASRVERNSPGLKLAWLDRADSLDCRPSELYELRGLVHLKLGNVEKASLDFERFRKLTPQSPIPPEYADLFVELASTTRQDQALKLLKEALAINPRHAGALHLQSVLRYREGAAPLEVLLALKEVQTADPARKPATEHVEAAMKYLREVAEKTWALDDKASRLSEWAKAIGLTEPVLRGAPADPPGPLLELAKMYRRLGQLEKALSVARRARESDESFLVRSQILFVMGQQEPRALADALREIDKALADPRFARAWYWRGIIRDALRLPDTAKDFAEASRRGLKGADLFMRRARSALAEGAADDVVRLAGQALAEAGPNEDEFVAMLAESGGNSLAEASLQLRIRCLYYRARGSYRKADYGACREDCEKILSIDPTHREALYHQGLALHDLKKYPEAVETFTKLIALDDKDPDALVARGSSRLMQRDLTGWEDYEQALKVASPDWPDRTRIKEKLLKR
jgi:tetratricopeptide (TPR) repeat protein